MAEKDFYYSARDRLHLKVKVHPGAARNRIDGVVNGELILRLQAQPEKGKANRELQRFLSKMLDIPRSEILIHSGETSHHKVLSLPQSAAARVQALPTEQA